MAALTPTFGFQKPLHSVFKITLESAFDTVSNAALLLGQPTSGLLYDFLVASYASSAAAETAWRALGGRITVRQTSGTATTVIGCTWEAQQGGGVPYLALSGGTDQVLEVVISIPHSAIQ